MGIEEIRIGTWYTECCHENLYQIENKDELDDILEDLIIDEHGRLSHWAIYGFWDTKLNALKEIKKWYSDVRTISEIDKLIRDEQRLIKNNK